MKLKLDKNYVIIFITFILLVMANGKYFIEIGINKYLEYFSLGLIVIECIYYFMLKIKEKSKLTKNVVRFTIVSSFFCIGILLQKLNFSIKLRLILTMIAMAIYMIISTDFLNTYKRIKYASYGLLAGTIVTTLISLATSTTVFEVIHDTSVKLIFNSGFTGGLEYKNFYGGVILASFMGIYICYKKDGENKNDFKFLIVLIVLEIISGAKGSIALLFLFLLCVNLDRFKIQCSKKNKYILIGIISICTLIVSFFIINKVILKSNTYAYRIRGAANYYDCYKSDFFHMFFGNAEMAFKNTNVNYVTNIRQDLLKHGYKSWDGSYEIALINILIKNGILGIIGYIYVFGTYIYEIIKRCEIENKKYIISILIVMIMSSFVESFICNIHAILGVFSYLLINGLINLKNKKICNYE